MPITAVLFLDPSITLLLFVKQLMVHFCEHLSDSRVHWSSGFIASTVYPATNSPSSCTKNCKCPGRIGSPFLITWDTRMLHVNKVSISRLQLRAWLVLLLYYMGTKTKYIGTGLKCCFIWSKCCWRQAGCDLPAEEQLCFSVLPNWAGCQFYLKKFDLIGQDLLCLCSLFLPKRQIFVTLNYHQVTLWGRRK